jgi:hypothetical protein
VDRIREYLRAPDPAPHPDARFEAKTGPLDLPRFMFVDAGQKAALTKQPPAYGMFVYDLQSDHIEQWVGDHWEAVAESLLGDVTGDPFQPVIRQTPAPFALGAGGGSAVGVAPRAAGDPSVVDPMPATPPTPARFAVYEISSNLAAGPVTVVDGGPVVTLFTFPSIDYTGFGPTPASLDDVVAGFSAWVTGTVPAGELLQLFTYSDGLLAPTANVADYFNVGSPVPVFGFAFPNSLYSGPSWFGQGKTISIRAQATGGVGNVTLTPSVGPADGSDPTPGHMAFTYLF